MRIGEEGKQFLQQDRIREVFRIKDIGSNTTRTIIGLALGAKGITKD